MVRPPLPQQGSEPPWGDALNDHIEALGTEIDGLTTEIDGLGTTYQAKSEKGQASGYASLDATGKVPSAQLPAASGGGVTDHGALTGLGDDDHPHYLTQSRGDSRYALVGHTHGPGGGTAPGAWFNGKKWYALGTSITIENSYTAKLATLSGMSLSNKGVSGATLSTASNGNIWNALTTQVGTDAEVITIETINDFRLNVPLGAITDAEDPAASYFGAMRAACNWILTNRPAARAFFFTAYGDAMNAGYPNGETPNTHGKHYWEYNDAMLKVARIYGIPVINVAEESGINFHTCQFYTNDMIHMNSLGGTRYGEYAWAKMLSLGWETSRPTAPGAAAPVPVASVTINQGDAYSLAPTQTIQLSVTIAPSNASNKSVVWSTSAAGVATVSLDGLVTGVAAGSANVTATTVDGSKTDVIAITVANAAVTGVTVAPDTWNAMPTNTQQLTATVAPTNATDKTVAWTSGTPAVATVNSSGLVTAVANGSATITATTTDGSFTDTCAVVVDDTVDVTGVDLTPSTASVPVSGTVQLTAAVLPANATNKAVTFASSDQTKATVDASGLVTGVALGSSTVTVTTQDGSITDTSAITVVGAEWSLSPQTTFTGNNLNGVTATGSDPTYTNVTQGTYGWFILNSAGHNAIEFTTKTVSGSWFVFGAPVGNVSGTGCGQGDASTGMTYNGDFLNGGITLRSGSVVPSYNPLQWAAGKTYRIGRSGNRVVVYRNDGGTLTKLWDGDLAANFPDASKYAEMQLGVLCGAAPGSPYTLPINCKTGIWTPPATALDAEYVHPDLWG